MDDNQKYQSLLVIVVGMLVLYFLFDKTWFLYIALGVGLISLFIPVIGDLIVKGWFQLAKILGWINSRILLGAIFYLFLLPIALLSRLFSDDNLLLKKGKEQNSTFFTRNHTYTKKDIENMW